MLTFTGTPAAGQRRSAVVTLRHATPARNLPGIIKAGLLTSKSRGKLPVVWLHAPGQTGWAVLHTVKRHHCRAEQVSILAVAVPRSWLRRSKKGLWYSVRDIPVDRIHREYTFAELAASPCQA